MNPDKVKVIECNFEDQGGWGGCPNPVVWQTKEPWPTTGKKLYFCREHKINKFVWDDDELEPLDKNELCV